METRIGRARPTFADIGRSANNDMETPKLSVIVPVYNVGFLVTTALESIPRRPDIEVIAYDDGSTDHTLQILQNYAKDTDLNLRVMVGGENHGAGYAKNRMLEVASGEWFHALDSDDYVYTDVYNELVDYLYRSDMDVVCFSLQMNDGSIHHLTEASRDTICAQTVRFIRREFAKGIKFPEDGSFGEDWHYNRALMARYPHIIYTDRVAYHYNHPRIGSLCDLFEKGLIECNIS